MYINIIYAYIVYIKYKCMCSNPKFYTSRRYMCIFKYYNRVYKYAYYLHNVILNELIELINVTKLLKGATGQRVNKAVESFISKWCTEGSIFMGGVYVLVMFLSLVISLSKG